VVNGVDRNLVRLELCVAVYRARFNAWPTHARFSPFFLWELAQLLDAENFEQLSRRMELRTQAEAMMIGISVGGSHGVQWYEGVDHGRIPPDAMEDARVWLGVHTRPGLGEYG
jgi:hypothetical protein